MSEYTEQAENFLKKHNLEFRAVLLGKDCPSWCEDALADRDMDKVDVFPRKTHIHGKHYRCTISGPGRGHVSFDFWNSYADEEQNWAVAYGYNKISTYSYNSMSQEKVAFAKKYKGKKRANVEAYDLLACLTKYDPGTFDDFCGDFGYDTDSRRAEDTYRAVQAEFRKVSKFFTAEEIEELQEIN